MMAEPVSVQQILPLPSPNDVYTDAWKDRIRQYFFQGTQFSDSSPYYWAFNFERQWEDHQQGVARELRLTKAISHWMPLAGRRVLVIGSFLGQEAIAFALSGSVVDAIDLDQEALSLSEELARRHGVCITTHNIDACATPFAAETFDIVTCSQVLEHLPPQRQPLLLREMRRVCRPGGLLWIDTPNQFSYKDKHDTGLPFIHWLPRPIKARLAKWLRRDIATNEPSFDFGKVGLHYYMSYFGILRILRKLGPCEVLSRYHGYADVDHYREHRISEGRAGGFVFPVKLALLRLLMHFWNFNWFSDTRIVVRR